MSGSPDSMISRRKLMAIFGGFSLAPVAGCTSQETTGLSGSIRISGSSTVYPIASAVSERFKDDNDDVTFDISRDGTTGGFNNVFIPGDSDINDASRKITSDEITRCEDNGFNPIEFNIAQDALTIVVNNANNWVDSISIETLGEIWSAETKPDTWAEVNSSWPEEPLDLYGAATTSGTFDYFTEEVLGEDGQIRSDFEGTERDDQIAAGVQGNDYALGYLPFAYYKNNPDQTKALPISTADGSAVEPSLNAASDGSYPLARPLFVYANSEKLRSKGHLQEFLEFFIESASEEELIAETIGYVPITESVVEENLDTLSEYVE